jgi:hypothetical protein
LSHNSIGVWSCCLYHIIGQYRGRGRGSWTRRKISPVSSVRLSTTKSQCWFWVSQLIKVQLVLCWRLFWRYGFWINAVIRWTGSRRSINFFRRLHEFWTISKVDESI